MEEGGKEEREGGGEGEVEMEGEGDGEEGEEGDGEEEEEGEGEEEGEDWAEGNEEWKQRCRRSPPPLIKHSPIASRTKKKPCPFCGAQVLKRSKKCSVCNRNFGVYTFGRKQCLFCGRVNLARMARCNECGQSLDKAPSARPKEGEWVYMRTLYNTYMYAHIPTSARHCGANVRCMRRQTCQATFHL